MLSKNQISFVNSLKQKKFREEQGLFIAEGAKIVPELLSSAIVVRQIYGTAAFLATISPGTAAELIEVKEAELERISALTTPNEALAVCEIPVKVLRANDLADQLTLVLDEIRDPGNLGTIIRIADWFGIGNIVCSMTSVDAFNPKVVQATMGSLARISIYYEDLVPFLEQQKSINQLKVFGALLEGENLYSRQLPSKGLIVIGNESKGISAAVQQQVTDKISIPSFSHFKDTPGEAESLNAAIATAIICSEFRRN